MSIRHLFFFSILSLTACSTLRTAPERGGEDVATKTVLPVPGARSGQGDGAVLLIAEFKGMDRTSDDVACRWRLVRSEDKKSFFLNIKPGEPNVFSHLEPGTYQTGRLGCGIARVWELDDVFKEGFTIQAGKTSYLGKLTFMFTGDTLDTVKKASRLESAQAFVKAIDAVPAANQQFVSGFSGKNIDRSMVEKADLQDGFDVFAKGVDHPREQLEPLVTHLRACAKTEGAADPVRFGRLQYTAIYKQGRFSEMKDRQEANGFSDRLRSCVERGIMGFHPAVSKNYVEVRVRY